MRAFADALDCVPMALAENSGLSPIETLANIKSRQAKEKNTRLGVDCMQTGSNGMSLSFFFPCPSLSCLLVFVLQDSYLSTTCLPPLSFVVFCSATICLPALDVQSRGTWSLPTSTPARGVLPPQPPRIISVERLSSLLPLFTFFLNPAMHSLQASSEPLSTRGPPFNADSIGVVEIKLKNRLNSG